MKENIHLYSKEQNYVEHARSTILNFGYAYVILKSNIKKAINTKIRKTQNNIYHYMGI